jgi:hypothetical protein
MAQAAQSLNQISPSSQAIAYAPNDIQLNNSFPPPHSPAASFMSKESYSTAISSPSSPDLQNTALARPVPAAASASLSLRKSISVDSFVHYGRETSSTVVTRPNRGHTGSALEPPTGLVGLRRDLNHVNQSGRSRGDSISSIKSSLSEDLDPDHSDDYNSPTDRYRLKNQDQSRLFVSGGELPLPSRTPTLSTASSQSSILSSTTSSSTQEAVPALRSVSSLQASRPSVSVDPGRARSGSLGVYTTPNTRRVQINTQIASEQNQAITIAVVGTAGCGKSVAIRKGLKNYNLSDPSGPIQGTHSSIRRTSHSFITGRQMH